MVDHRAFVKLQECLGKHLDHIHKLMKKIKNSEVEQEKCLKKIEKSGEEGEKLLKAILKALKNNGDD